MAFKARRHGGDVVTVRVQGETYESSAELLEEIEQLGAARDQTPEYGPRRKQLDEHIEKLQAAYREQKRREAREHRTDEDGRRRKGERDQTRRQREQQQKTTAARKRRRDANARVRSGARDLVSGSRRDVRRAAGALHVAEPISGAADLAWTTVGVALGLIVLFMLVNERGRGPAAVHGITHAGSTFLARLLDPADPIVFGSAPAGGAVGAVPAPAAPHPFAKPRPVVAHN